VARPFSALLAIPRLVLAEMPSRVIWASRPLIELSTLVTRSLDMVARVTPRYFSRLKMWALCSSLRARRSSSSTRIRSKAPASAASSSARTPGRFAIENPEIAASVKVPATVQPRSAARRRSMASWSSIDRSFWRSEL
jgi:hypothetical protein